MYSLHTFSIPEIPELFKHIEYLRTQLVHLETRVAALEYLIYEDDEPQVSTAYFSIDIPNVENMSNEEIAEFFQKIAQKFGYEMGRAMSYHGSYESSEDKARRIARRLHYVAERALKNREAKDSKTEPTTP